MSPPLTLDNTFGALLVSALFSMMLWGVTCTQTYDYFMNNADRRLQRSIVALLWVIDTFGSVLHTHIAYYFLVTTYGKPISLLKSSWSLHLLSFATGIPTFIIRCMFARRIYQFNKRNIIIPAWIVILSICEIVLDTVMSVRSFQGLDFVTKNKLAKLLYTSFSLGLTADLSVTIALCWLLQSSKSGFQKSDSVVNLLMAYVVNTGLLVTIIASVGLIVYIAMPDNLVFMIFFILGSKLYLNAYLATLNARGKLRGALNSETSIPLSRLRAPNVQGSGAQGVVLSDEKSASFPGSTLDISLQSHGSTVERRVDASHEGKHTHVV